MFVVVTRRTLRPQGSRACRRLYDLCDGPRVSSGASACVSASFSSAATPTAIAAARRVALRRVPWRSDPRHAAVLRCQSRAITGNPRVNVGRKLADAELDSQDHEEFLDGSHERTALAQDEIARRVEEALRARGFKTRPPPTLIVPPSPQPDDIPRQRLDPAEFLHDLVTKGPEASRLEQADVESILQESKRLFLQLPGPVLDVQIPAGVASGDDPRVIVVGDTHGQLPDVLHIFKEHGPPSKSCIYIFNGDISDRGHYAIEIWLLVLAYKLVDPETVHILRGNHENHMMNKRPRKWGGGFVEECCAKYSMDVYDRFQRLFELLPLFAVVENDVFVVHAGLFRTPGVKLEQLRQLPYRMHYPTPHPNTSFSDDEAILFDAQWSDPGNAAGIRGSKRGKVVVSFGPDITKRFLSENNLSLCIRSHEVPKMRRGFQLTHDKRLLTVFSASNYSGRIENSAAIAVLRAPRADGDAGPSAMGGVATTPAAPAAPLLTLGGGVTVHCVEHVSAALKSGVCQPAGLKQTKTAGLVAQHLDVLSRGDTLTEASRDALGLVFLHREELWSRWHDADKAQMGVLGFTAAMNILKDVCGDFDWPTLFRQLAPFGSQIAYRQLLNAVQIQWNVLDSSQAETLARAMLCADLPLDSLSDLFDYSHDGTVTPQEVRNTLSLLLPSLKQAHMHKVCKLFGSEPLAVSELVQRLLQFAPPLRVRKEWMDVALTTLLEMIREWAAKESGSAPPPHKALLQFFRFMDKNRDSFVTTKELADGIIEFERETMSYYEKAWSYATPESELPRSHLTPRRIHALTELMDFSQDGSVSFLEFVWAFQHALDALDQSQGVPAASVLEGEVLLDKLELHQECSCTALIFVYRGAVLAGCQALDQEGAGKISPEDFISVVETLGRVTNTALTKPQFDALQQSLAGEDIDYFKALTSFSVGFHSEQAVQLGSMRSVL